MHLQAALNQRVKELEAQDTTQGSDPSDAASSGPETPQTTAVPSSWISGWLPTSLSGAHHAKQPAQLTPEQKEALKRSQRESQAKSDLGPPPTPPKAPKGLYLHGSVGSGKSLLMDLFYDAVANTLPRLEYHRRVHFNAAMLEV